MKARTTVQYRVVSERQAAEGRQRSVKTYGSMKAVLDRVGRLTSPEPWKFWGDASDREREGDEYACCAGTRYDECNCGGETLKQKSDAERAALPPIVSITVQKRTVTRTPWEAVSDVTFDVPTLAAHVTGHREGA